jgi:hypothetical protein
MKNKLFLLSFFYGISLGTHAQKNTYPQSLYWIRYQLQLQFSPRLYWSNEADNRRFFNPDVENQLIFHSRMHYKTGAWDLAGGLTLSYAFASRPENGYAHVTTEVRPVAEVTHELPLKRITVQNRLRLDNRFFEVSETENIWGDSRYITRIRYRFQLRMPVKKSGDKTIINFRVADEIMINAQENIFDQNRIYATADFYLNKSFTLETGYLYIYQQRFATDDFFSRHVLRFSILHKIDLSKN